MVLSSVEAHRLMLVSGKRRQAKSTVTAKNNFPVNSIREGRKQQ